MSAEQRKDCSAGEKAPKRRAACDECRVKKLKCGGEHPTCSRCQREHIDCIYSVQKPMGRPKKRRKSAEDDTEGRPQSAAPAQDISTWPATEAAQDDLDCDCAHIPMQEPHIALWGNAVVSPQPTWSNEAIPTHGVVDAQETPAPLTIPSELTRPYTRSSISVETPSLTMDDSVTSETTPQAVPALPPCACLSTMYLTLNELSVMDTSAPFPGPLYPLRAATTAAAEILACTECPKSYFSGMQNTSAMSSLLMGIAERYSKVLSNISIEAERAAAADETKRFRLSDIQSTTTHLRAGGLGAIASFTITMSPQEWRQTCKKVVRAEVYGPNEGNECCPDLAGVMDQMETRQRNWHTRHKPGGDLPGAVPSSLEGLTTDPAHLREGENPLCLKQLGFSRHMLNRCDWS